MKKFISVFFLGAIASFYSVASADQLAVSIDGFADPQNFSITATDPLLLRVTELVPAADTNTSTHILIEGLSPLEEGSLDYASTYSGIDVNSGVTQDTGVLYLKMPQGSELPAGTVASPIVGVVQRNLGDWSNYSLSYPLTDISNSITGATPQGIGDYDGLSLSMSLSNEENTYLGTADYDVLDTDTLLLHTFTLTIDGGASLQMGESILIRDGNRFYGTLTNLDPNASYDSLIFTIDLTNIPDLDGDTLPDIVDPVVSSVLVPGQWSLNPDLGYVWGGTPSIGYSVFLGWISMAEYPVLYHFGLGWLQVVTTPGNPDPGYWMHSPTLGWIYTEASWSGIFFQESGGWIINNFMNPNQ